MNQWLYTLWDSAAHLPLHSRATESRDCLVRSFASSSLEPEAEADCVLSCSVACRNMTAKWADAAIQVIAFDEAAEADKVTGGLRFRCTKRRLL